MILTLKRYFNKNLLIKSGSIFLAYKIIAMIIGYILVWIIARYFGASAQGIFSLLITIVGIVVILGKLGIEVTILKHVATLKTNNHFSEIKNFFTQAIRLSFVSSLILSLILFFCADLIAVYLLHKPFMGFYIKIGALVIFPIVLLQLNAEFARAFGKIGQYSFLNLFVSFFSVIILAYFVLQTDIRNESTPVIVQIIANLLMCIFSIFLIIKLIPWKKTTIASIWSMKKILKISFPMMHVGLLIMMLEWLDILLLGALVDEKKIGIYSIVVRIATLNGLSLLAVSSILIPKISELFHASMYIELQRMIRKSAVIISLTTLPVMVSVIIFSEPLLAFFGEEFTEGVSTFIVLCLAYAINAILGPVDQFLLMTGGEKFNRQISFYILIIFLISGYYLITIYGIFGIAIAKGITMLLKKFIFSIYIYRKHKLVFLYSPFIRKSLIGKE
ncbi:oligosaccharide flippase family protein [candidate division KSB1 bacterium]